MTYLELATQILEGMSMEQQCSDVTIFDVDTGKFHPATLMTSSDTDILDEDHPYLFAR